MYYAINPEIPQNQTELLQRDSQLSKVPILSLKDSTIYTAARDSREVKTSQLLLIKTSQLYRLSHTPLKLRHSGSHLSLELYLDLYSQTINQPISDNFYPPSQPENYFLDTQHYFVSKAMYVFEEVMVPSSSQTVWDGRSNFTVDLNYQRVDIPSQLEKIRSKVKQIVLSLKNPDFILSMGDYKTGVTLEYNSEPETNFYFILDKFIAEHYNSSRIPEQPTELAQFKDDPPISGKVRNIAARVDDYNFIDWVVVDV